MKTAVATLFFAKWDVDVEGEHKKTNGEW
jgi:hypothetical protein